MSKSIICFYDPVCPSPYTLDTLENKSLGGTEASCLRVAKGLRDTGHRVFVAQRNRDKVFIDTNLIYTPLDTDPTFTEEGQSQMTVITLRDAGFYVSNQKQYPNAKHWLWMHDVVSGDYVAHMIHHLKDLSEVNMICVSDWHKLQILDAIQPHLPKLRMNVHRIYGPLAQYCTKTESDYDPNKLIFFSSPHKGLDQTLEIFTKLRAIDKDFTLYVSNPGYFKDKDTLPEGVVNLGTLTHREVIEHVRTSLCLFYPNPVFPETFGLVMAEADAVGTPVIAHRIGAAPEVVFHHKEILNCLDHESVIKRVLAYKAGERLIVKGKKEYQLSSVIKEWEKLL